MPSLEIISVRLFDGNDEMKVRRLFDLNVRRRTESETGPIRAVLYKNASVMNDWSIHLVQPIGRVKQARSSTAARMVEDFKQVGLVDYTVWVGLTTGT